MRALIVVTLLGWAAVACAGEPVRIPLVKGMVRVAAIQRPSGDEEHILTVTRSDGEIVEFTVLFRSMGAKEPGNIIRTREVRREDLVKSNRQNVVFQEGDPPKFPGSTLAHFSAATLAELKTAG
ncbi:MAG: hypothetical protein ABI588_08035, partial [Arenimonas sp.]